MKYKVKLKCISPLRTLSLGESCTFATLPQFAEKIHSMAVNNSEGVVLVEMNQIEFSPETPIQVYFPINQADFMQFYYDEFIVLPRINVATTLHKGSYQDLAQAFAALHQHIQEHQYTPTQPCRIIYRKSETLLSLLKSDSYTTEVQIPLVSD